jgi:chromate transport protein ChrA
VHQSQSYYSGVCTGEASTDTVSTAAVTVHSLLLLLQLHLIATTTAMLAVVRAVCTLVSACAVQLLLQLLLVLLTVMLPTALTYTVNICLHTLRTLSYCNGAQ